MAGVGEGIEDLFIQAPVAQAAVEAFDQTVLLRFAWLDVVPGDAGITCPFEDCGAGELGAAPRENGPPDRFLILVDR